MAKATIPTAYPLAVMLALGAIGSAAASDADSPPANTGQAAATPEVTEVETVTVTGSRIARPEYVSESPIVSVDAAKIQSSGQSTLEGVLNQLPQVVTSASASANLNNRGGQASINLRSLGAQRTMVLIDGRRMQPASADGTADLNMLPLSVIKSVEVITGGASAVYGSDAVTGVVNFKLRDDLEGVEASAQYDVAGRGDGATQDYNVLVGGKFADNRGYALIALNRTLRDTVLASSRPWGGGAGSPTLPEGNWNVDSSNLPTQAAMDSVFGAYGSAPGAVSKSSRLYFNTDGSLFTQTGPQGPVNYRDGFTGLAAPNFIINNGLNFSSTGFLALQTPLDRYSFFSNAKYEVNSHVRVFAQAMYTNYHVTVLRPPGVAGSSSSFVPLSIPATNPFIPDDLATLLASRPNPDAPITITKRTSEAGATFQRFDYDVYNITLGAEGDLFSGWTWNADVSYGLTGEVENELNYNSSIALNSLLNAPDGGASLCDGGYDPFGLNALSPSCINYVNRNARSTTDIKQTVAEVNLQGDIFSLPAGDVRLALGGNYRKTEFSYVPDALISTGELAGYLPIQGSSGSTDVREIYGEVLVPLTNASSLIGESNLDAAYRYSDYDSIGGVSTYKADVDWRPLDFVRLRGGYSRAIRAPSVGELFAPQQLGRVGLGAAGPAASGDACDVRSAYRNSANAAQVRALCLAQGVPSAVIDTYRDLDTAVPFQTGGNSDLNAEVANTFSGGAVFNFGFEDPLFADLSVSVDYYSISLKGAIGQIDNPLAMQRCFNADGSNPNYDPSNYYCQLITRNPGDGDIGLIQNPKFNLGGFYTDGIDVTANWSFPVSAAGFGDDVPGNIQVSVNLNYLKSFEIQTLPGVPFVDYGGTIGNTQIESFATARPHWKAISSIGYVTGPFDVSLQWRYLGSMENAANVGTGGSIPDTSGVNYFDVTTGYQFTDYLQLRVGIQNLTDVAPPPVNTDANGQPVYDTYTYDVIGRRYFVQVKADF